MVPTNILVPTDLSERAERALDYAVDLAARLDATVHLVHVIAVPATSVPELGVALASTMIDSLVADDQKALDNLVEARKDRCRFGQRVLATGDARDAIKQTAENLGADLIVMGTHGRRGIVRALLGSVAESVVRSAPCPVLTVCAPETAHRDAA